MVFSAPLETGVEFSALEMYDQTLSGLADAEFGMVAGRSQFGAAVFDLPAQDMRA
jgi:hypothetical protein